MSDNKQHAFLSPSSALKWVNCPGAKAAEAFNPPQGGFKYADEGTAAHFLASETLTQKDGDIWKVPLDWQRKRSISVGDNGAKWYVEPDDPRTHLYITPEMADFVQHYVSTLYGCAADGGVLLVEQALSLEPITGEKNAFGTADAVILKDGELQIHDLKYGMRRVEAKNNYQLLVYAAAAVEEYGMLYPIDKVTVAIHQPRITDGHSSWTLTVKELESWVEGIKFAAVNALGAAEYESLEALHAQGLLKPGEHCSNGYCAARATCPALKDLVITTTDSSPVPELLDNAELAATVKKIPTIIDWCKEVQGLLESKVLNGEVVPGYKAVVGRAGDRKWSDEKVVEDLLKSMKINHDVIYKKSLNSPTAIEKAAKEGNVGPRQWPKLKEHIVREPGELKVVPESDKRPAVEVEDPLNLF